MIDPQSGWNEHFLCPKFEKTELQPKFWLDEQRLLEIRVIFQSPNYQPTFNPYLNSMAVSPS